MVRERVSLPIHSKSLAKRDKKTKQNSLLHKHSKHVVGRLHQESQPRNDAGHDENRFLSLSLSQIFPPHHDAILTPTFSHPFCPGHVEKTNDRDYEVEERRFRTMEAASLRLQKEAKGYLDSLRAMTASQMRIAETIDAFYGDAGAKDGVSRSYKQAVEDLDAETIKALDGPYRTTVLEPISRFCAYFPDVNECK